MKTEAVDEPDPHAADERPDAAIVIMVRQVEKFHRIIGAPVGIAGLYDRVKIRDGPRIMHADAPHEAESGAGAFDVEQLDKEREDDSENVAPPVEREGRDLRN